MSAVFYEAFFALRWIVFLVRWLAAALFGLATFISKPGSRIMCPVAAAVIAYEYPWQVHSFAAGVLGLHFRHLTRDDMQTQLIVALVAATIGYIILSKILVVVLGTFMITRPLRPLRRLRSNARPIKPVRVTMAVPRLPRRRWRLRIERVVPADIQMPATPQVMPAPPATPASKQLTYEPVSDFVFSEDKTS